MLLNSDMPSTDARHPIGYVAKRAGISTHVVRIWEKRYGAVTPQRSATGRRLYSDADIDRLRLLNALSSAGHSIGQIASLPDAELKGLLRDASQPEPGARTFSGNGGQAVTREAEDFLVRCQDAVRELDAEALEKALMDARVALSEPIILQHLVAPLMNWIGDAWHGGEVRVAQEHMASAVVRGFLWRLRQSGRHADDGPVVVLATPAGESHEIGALLAATVAASEGWREIYLGPNLPAVEVASAAVSSGARIVGLSIALPGDNPVIARELEDLRQYLPETTAIVVGGGGGARHADLLQDLGAHYVPDLESFRAKLGALRA